MSDRLDDLARTLARPMPRGGALRLLGRALLVTAVPGGLTGAARAATGRSTACTGCGVPHGAGCVLNKTCGSGDMKGFPVCCKWPGFFGSFQYGPAGGQCAQAGGHGLNPPGGLACCCPAGSACGAPPGPPCVATQKVCGPDVTGALESALGRVKSTFAGWSDLRRANVCGDLVTLPAAAFNWDVRELGPGGREAFQKRYGGCSSCGYTVAVGGRCHYSGSVNYVVYGVMMRLCHDHFSSSDSWFADWFTREEMLEMIYMHKNKTGTQAGNFQASNEWALAGYETGTVRPTPPAERPQCTPCPDAYAGPGLTVNWLPFTIRP